MTQSKELYRLQKIDLALDTRRRRLREITAALEQDSALRAAQARVSEVQQALRPQEARASSLTLEMQSVTQQSAQVSERLYSGKVHNPKELQEMEGKIEELKRRRADLENHLLETMIQVEDLQRALAEANEALRQITANWGTEQQALADEQHRLKREIKAYKAERETSVQAITAEHLTLYDDLRAKKQGRAVAVLKGDACSECGVSQTTLHVQQIRQGQSLMLCSSCGRILVAL